MNRPGQDSQDDRVVLPYGYVPSAIDVICGRDSESFKHGKKFIVSA